MKSKLQAKIYNEHFTKKILKSDRVNLTHGVDLYSPQPTADNSNNRDMKIKQSKIG